MQVEKSVIESARLGDPHAFDEIVMAYRPRVLGTVYRLLGQPRDVEDVGQEAFVRLWKSFSQLRSADLFEPWLYRVTVNAVYDHLRKRQRNHDTPMSDLNEEHLHMVDGELGRRTFDAQQQHNEVRDFVLRLFKHISAEDRILLVMKEVQGLSLNELEQVYGVDANTLKVRLFRARKRALRAIEKMESHESAANTVGSPVPLRTVNAALAAA